LPVKNGWGGCAMVWGGGEVRKFETRRKERPQKKKKGKGGANGQIKKDCATRKLRVGFAAPT